jgi:hypothetical protein
MSYTQVDAGPQSRSRANVERPAFHNLVVEIHGRTVPAPITLLSISRASMAIRTSVALPVETSERFHIRLEDGEVVKLTGHVMRCEPQGSAYVIGVCFAYPIGGVFEDITRGSAATYNN